MTEQEIAGFGPAFANYLGRFRACLGLCYLPNLGRFWVLNL